MDQQTLNILFLGGAKRVSLAERLIETGKSTGVKVGIFSYELTEQLPIASVGTVIKGLRWKDEHLFTHLKQTIDQYQISVVLPFVDPAIEVACLLKTECPQLFIPVSEIGLCRTMFDKTVAQQWFEAHQISAPRAYAAESVNSFPVIAKPRTGSASKGIEILSDVSEWLAFKKSHNTDQYLIQQYIAHRDEFTVDAYVSQSGLVWCAVPRIRQEVTGGEATTSETVADTEILTESLRLLQSAPFRGPVTVQYMRDKTDGKLYIIEINPRYGGGVIASLAAGANSLEALLCEALNREIPPSPHWQSGVVMTRYFKEVIFYATHH